MFLTWARRLVNPGSRSLSHGRRGKRRPEPVHARPRLEPLEARCLLSAGMFDPSTATWYLRNSNTADTPDVAPFAYGAPGWVSVNGDWNGDGTTTIGMVDPSSATWYLRNENSAGSPDAAAPFQYGLPGWVPVTGDWNGSGHTGIGMFDSSTGTWYLRNEDNAG